MHYSHYHSFRLLFSYFVLLTASSFCFAAKNPILKPDNKDLTGILLIGQSYENSDSKDLHGCINDIENLKYFFTETKGFPEENILMLKDSPYKILKADSLLKAIDDMAKSTQETASNRKKTIIIAYSGHGSQLAARPALQRHGTLNPNGKDECLVAGDRPIRDTELHEHLRGFHKESTVLFIFDACHSATLLNLRHSYTHQYEGFLDKTKLKKLAFYTDIDARIVSISSCFDNQKSKEAVIPDVTTLTNEVEAQGVFTQSLIKLFQTSPCIPLFSLMKKINSLHRTQRVTVSCNHILSPEDTVFGW